MSMIPGLIFACMRQAAALERRIENFRHLSEPAVFVLVATRQKSADFFEQQTASASEYPGLGCSKAG